MKLIRRISLTMLAVPGIGRAQCWPARPWRVVVRFASDGTKNLIAEQLARPVWPAVGGGD